MNKKIYETPMVTVTTMEAESFCADSISRSLDKTTSISGQQMLSKENRGFDLWSEDSEE